MTTKYCKRCKQEKPLSDFSPCKSREKTEGNFKRTYVPKDGLSFYCKQCNAEKARAFRQKYKAETGNADYRGTGKIKVVPKEERILMSAIRARVTEARQNNKRYPDRVFDIDALYMYQLFKEQKGLCALTKEPIQIEGDSNYRLSIDKVNPELGYVKGNVQWTIFAANRAKGDLTQSQLITLCEQIIKSATTIENTEKSGSE